MKLKGVFQQMLKAEIFFFVTKFGEMYYSLLSLLPIFYDHLFANFIFSKKGKKNI